MTAYRAEYLSPFGPMTMVSDGEALTALVFQGQKYYEQAVPCQARDVSLPVFRCTTEWLNLYFAGRMPEAAPTLAPKGTKFQEEIWEILRQIPYGRTLTYGEIAARVAARRGIVRMSAQAVGGAVGRNPIALLIPCHRVVGTDGSLTGYAGGIEKKAALLALEKDRATRNGR